MYLGLYLVLWAVVGSPFLDSSLIWLIFLKIYRQEEVARTHGRTVQKDLHDPDNHDDVITNLEPDIVMANLDSIFKSVYIFIYIRQGCI